MTFLFQSLFLLKLDKVVYKTKNKGINQKDRLI